MLKESLIENNSIKLNQTAANWEEAIKIGTDLLVASGAIEPRYYENIVSKIKEMGPYIVLAPGLAMPHARPEEGVIRTAFGLTTLVGQILTALLVFISDAAIASCVNDTVPITAPATADSVITATFLDLVLPFA